ncbi:Pc06g02340 [Penicillium rubens Wisconsin 54-1255]|uniref:Pc06g02340 protein n=1 Tax=Penicillium rubens (strain ATCC 28089 / DSM 1075 / NRRL 1951 / Wisconsin 54-1255) TaxID=500485 RepID=B6GWG6_PENRW|nr:Pc06g02340 [Penicillium rubens Wisconsin 54-1255]
MSPLSRNSAKSLLPSRWIFANFDRVLVAWSIAHPPAPSKLTRRLTEPLSRLLSIALIFSYIFPCFILAAQPGLFALSDLLELLSHAHGVVLEFGAGRGHTLTYYDPAKVYKVWAVEPNEENTCALSRKILQLGLNGTCQNLRCGIEDAETLRHVGIIDETVDTVVCILSLCTIPTPRDIISDLYSLMKPAGGQLLFLEHVDSEHSLTRTVQNWYTSLIWPYVTGGCELNRDTAKWCVEVMRNGNETPSSMEVHNIAGGWWNVFPHVSGRLVKA